MSSLILPRRFTQPPHNLLSVEVDYSHPLMAHPGAVAYLLGGKSNFNNNNPSIIIPKLVQPYGKGLGLSSAPVANDTNYISPIIAPNKCTNALTVIAFGSIGSLASEEHICSWHQDGTQATLIGPFNFGCTGAQKKVRLELRIAGSYSQALGATTVLAGVPYAFAGTYDKTNINVYLNGVKDGTTAQTAAMQIGNQGFDILRHNRVNNANSYLSGSLSLLIYIPDYAATQAEILSISKNPWQIIKPRKSVLYFGGGTPTNYPSAADSGSIALTGSAANGVRALAGVAASGSITLTGSAANAVRALAGVAASGSITLTGSNAAALRTWLGVAGAGSITLTGSDAAGVKAGSGAYTSAADVGSITLSGSAAVGTYDRLAAAGSGSITLTGSDASGIRNIPATAEASSIVLTGSAAVGIRTWLAVAEAGSITLSGSDAEGVYGGAMTLTPADLDAIAAAVWADPAAVAAHAKLDEIIARITC